MAEKISIIIGAQDKFSDAFGKLTSKLPSIRTLAIGASAAVAGTGTALFAMAKSTATAYDSMGKFSSRIGISTEALSQYQHIADRSGISNEQLRMGFQRMTRRISEASVGVGVAQGALKELGIEIDQIAGRAPDKQFEIIAGALEGVGSQADKVRLAMQFFDSEGVALLQTLSDGTAGLDAMKAEAEKFGLVVSAQASANAAEFNDSLTRVTGSLTGLKNKMAEEVMPTITGLANRFADFVANNREQIISYGVKFLEVMGSIAEKGVYAVALLVDSWRGLQMTWEALKIGFAEFSIAMWEGIGWLQEKLVSFMEVMNFGGVFDSAIEKAQSFTGLIDENIAVMENMSKTAMQKIEELAGQEKATEKIAEITDKIKTAIAEIQASGTAEVPAGIHPFDDANVEQTAVNMEALKAMHDEYLLTEGEKLDQWYATELEKYRSSKEAKVMLDEIYGKRKADLKKKLDKEELKSEKIQQDGMSALAQLGAVKGFGILKALAIPEIWASTETGAIAAYKALAGIPVIGPALGKAAALAIRVYGTARAAAVQGLSFAHEGLEYVPAEAPYMLARGERVVSAQQNVDLVEFMDKGGGTFNIENFIFQVPATLDELGRMDREDWRSLAEDRIIPALRELSTAGIKI